MGNHEELLYWIALRSVRGIGNLGFLSLLESFKSPREAFLASYDELIAVPGIGSKTASHIKSFQNWRKSEQELNQLNSLDIQVITFHDECYPELLKNIYDPPPLLYVKGTLTDEDLNIALVGSRMASTYGLYTTERLSRELALNGITVVSGMARGIDSAAHRGALAGRGRTLAVLGCGLDIIYPPENKNLYEEITASGAVISEFAPGTPPNASNFPLRNRIISGLSLGVVVVEANERSGSLITARIALEQGREVFAVPGSIDSRRSRGSHKLIKEGAKLIENVGDILEDILPQIERGDQEAVPDRSPEKAATAERVHFTGKSLKTSELPEYPFSENEERIFSILTDKPIHLDAIIEKSGLNVTETLNSLLHLELYDEILQLPGKLYQRKEKSCRIP